EHPIPISNRQRTERFVSAAYTGAVYHNVDMTDGIRNPSSHRSNLVLGSYIAFSVEYLLPAVAKAVHQPRGIFSVAQMAKAYLCAMCRQNADYLVADVLATPDNQRCSIC